MKTYAIVGLGHRAYMYLNALTGEHAAGSRLIALCDVNPGRLAHAADAAARAGAEPRAYAAADFQRMIGETSPDRVIVTVPDHAHAEYIVRTLQLGCDVITEKPLTVDAKSCRRIIEARQASGRSVIVGFNYRYSPARTLLKQVLMSGIIGQVNRGQLRMAARHSPWRRLFPALAPEQREFRRAVRAQGHAPFRSTELVAGRGAVPGERVRDARILSPGNCRRTRTDRPRQPVFSLCGL